MYLAFVVALLVRIVYVLAFRESPFFNGLIVDAQWHDAWGLGWANGTWSMNERAFFRAPLYPFWLSLLYRVFGHDLLAVRIAQAILGAGAAAALSGCGWRIGGKRVALWSGGIAAFYGPLVFFDGELLIPSLLVALLSWSLFFFLSPPSRGRYLIGALFLGLSVIARPTALVLLPVALLFLSRRTQAHPQPSKTVLVWVLLVSLIPSAAVTLMNAKEEKAFVFIASQGGINFYAGNHAGASGRSVAIPEFERVQNSWADFVEASYRVPADASGTSLNSRETSDFWTRRAAEWIGTHPGDALRLTLKKAYYAVNASEMPNNRDLYFDRPFPLNLLLWQIPWFAFPWGLIFPLSVVGAILGFKTKEKRPATGLLVGWVVCYGLLLLPFFLCARFRLGMIPAIILLAAIALSNGKRMFRTAPLIAGLMVLVFVNSSFFQARAENAPQELAKRGVAALNQGRVEDAVRDLEEAVQERPRSAKYSYFLGQAYVLAGNKERAYQFFRRSLDLGATNYRILDGIGSWFLEMKLYADATIALERLVEERPDDGNAWVNLGQAYEHDGKIEKAIEAYRGAIDVAPRNERAHLDLGFAYQEQGDSVSAISAWRHGTELIPDSYALHYNLALVLAQDGQYLLSLDAAGQAIRINPDAPAARSLHEWLVEEMKTPEE